MSGGHFDYAQHRIRDIYDGIQRLILNNSVPDEYGYKREYKKEILLEFKKALYFLERAEIYAQRIDWLVSGDDGEESFLKRLEEELQECQNQLTK